MPRNTTQIDENAEIYQDKHCLLPLEDGTFSIRLVTIFPDLLDSGDGNSILQCDLRTATFDNAKLQQYTCLLYVWNHPTLNDEEVAQGRSRKYRIRLNDRPFTVGRNLHDFLETARIMPLWYPDNRYQPFWIEAICINQSEKAELSNQVQRMNDIYSSAKGVITWLGKDRDLANFLRELQKQYKIRLEMEKRGEYLDNRRNHLFAPADPPGRRILPGRGVFLREENNHQERRLFGTFQTGDGGVLFKKKKNRHARTKFNRRVRRQLIKKVRNRFQTFQTCHRVPGKLSRRRPAPESPLVWK
ncbi:hypothetical protein BU23DRAFT_268620 [Bimuria novae-zelandiae CBS 107.79]|uniref:Heterokaryon incompatibility domain-containing protein n=1 Tax=Bimuria novae-zelandiae CBS 107.79 TaxID=1447943 RepID=A0A6A5UTA8_9PLEO|nr:hypothetical protein BU23DRAFT_268620 [Bimuria novae-zelandiae CBS 107.79]